MSKDKTQHVETTEPSVLEVAALRAEMAEMRALHTAELQALRDELRSARAVRKEAPEIPPDAPPEVRGKLAELALQQKLLEAMDPQEAARRQKESFERGKARLDENITNAWRELLDGEVGFLCVTETAPSVSEGYPKAMDYTTRFVAVRSTSLEGRPRTLDEARRAANEKYQIAMGHSAHHPFVFIVALSPEETATIRAKLDAEMRDGPREDALKRICVEHMAAHIERKRSADIRANQQHVRPALPNRFEGIGASDYVRPGLNAPYQGVIDGGNYPDSTGSVAHLEAVPRL